MVRRIRLVGWLLAAALAVLALQRLGWQQLAHAIGAGLHALAQAVRLVLGADWRALLLAAAGLVLGLALTSSSARMEGPAIEAAVRRLWVRPVTRLIRWLLASASLLALLVLVVAVLPPRFTAHRHFDKATDELKAQNDVRTTLLQALAGALLATGAYLTWRQVHVNREGQITDRYTKAVEQLGHDELDVRLGGIYALERIARDSPQDRATIEEVLTAFVRGHAPWPPPSPASAQPVATEPPATAREQSASPAQPEAATATAASDRRVAAQGPPADVQAAVTVLGRRPLSPDGLRLDLTRVDLRRVQLIGANLQYANLQHANLGSANLRDANLRYALLQEAKLLHADLQNAILRGADLQHADLQHAILRGADLQSTNLRHAILRGADLQSTNLRHADLRGADLQGTNLRHAGASSGTWWPEGWDRYKAEDRGVLYEG